MPWIALTEEHVLEGLSTVDLDALRKIQQAPGALDPMPGILARTASEVQGYVATRYPVGQAGTVPDQLLSAAAAIARWRLLGSLPIRQLSTEHRKGEYDDAWSRLRDVSAGKFALDIPTSPATTQPGPAAGTTAAWGSTKEF